MNEPRQYFDDAFYFGCYVQKGHYLYTTLGRQVYNNQVPTDFPFVNEWVFDGNFCPRGPEIEGRANLWTGAGWTVLSFWDRSVDSRGKCNSVFIMRGTFTFDEAVARAKERFPAIFERFTFKIVPHVPGVGGHKP